MLVMVARWAQPHEALHGADGWGVVRAQAFHRDRHRRQRGGMAPPLPQVQVVCVSRDRGMR